MKFLYRNNSSNQSGSLIFELLLFMPLFFIFIVVVVDLGLAFLEHSSVVNSSRAFANTLTATLHSSDFSRSDSALNTELDFEVAEDHLRRAIDSFVTEVSNKKLLGDSTLPQLEVQAAIILLSVDPLSGELLSTELDDVVFVHSSYPTQQSLLAESSFKVKDYVPPRKFLADRLEQAGKSIPSLYAKKNGLSSAQKSFSPLTTLLYLEVSAEASGLKRFGVYSLFGKFFTLQQQELFILRD